jgi:hypothetical protein
MKFTPIAIAVVLAIMTCPTAIADDNHCQDGVGSALPATTADQFERPGNGTVIDRSTALQWAQCAVGQSWSDGRCDGPARAFTWAEARRAIDGLNTTGALAGLSDWRLPSKGELESLIETCRTAPAIHTGVFPGTPAAGFWTRSASSDEIDHAWFVGFYSGIALEYRRDAGYRVRPVRDHR